MPAKPTLNPSTAARRRRHALSRSHVLSKPPTAPGLTAPPTEDAGDLQLPHERDESTDIPAGGTAGEGQFEQATQAARDLAQGQVDTDLHTTPGLDAEHRADLLDAAKDAATEAAQASDFKRGTTTAKKS